MCDDSLLQACMAERQRIGREIHDTISQDLAGAKLLLQALEGRLKKHAAPEEESVARIVECMDLAISHLRCITRGLVAVHIASSELPYALGRLCDEMGRLHAVTCRFRSDGCPRESRDGFATHLYCVAREALCNAIRHGKASRISVSLRMGSGGGRLTVSDNGNGLAEKAEHLKGIGLEIMRHRAQQVGGKLTMAERRGGGMTLKCSFVDAG